jgi:DNA-binding response OmpR family regulator
MADLILIVEDNKATSDAVKSIFQAENYEVETADCGEAAIEKITSKEYILVMLDVMLPRVDGFEVCRRIRSSIKNSKTPVIMLTALDIPEIGKRSTEAGANDVVIKPFRPDDLMAKVKKIIPNI